MKSHEGNSHSQTEFQRLGIFGGTITTFDMEAYSDYHFRARVVTKDGYKGAWSNEYHIVSSGKDQRGRYWEIPGLKLSVGDCDFVMYNVQEN
jgi:hypothetical protein